MNFENILENRCGKGFQGICDDINHPYRVVNSGDKRISKKFAEIAGCLGYKQRHHKQVRDRKCVRLEISINTYLEELSKEIIQKANMITIFRTSESARNPVLDDVTGIAVLRA